ncbi:WD repeat-containing protein 70 [Rhinophrynus dorsalis]
MDEQDESKIAATMGFSGFGKKARTFDLEAMFEQTRRTAVERSKKTFEEREREEEKSKEEKPTNKSPGLRGAASSSGQKHVEQSDSSSGSEDSSDDELIGPPAPSNVSDSEEELIGPPLPSGFKDSDDDEEEEEEGDDDDDDNPVKRIPDSHEITLQHGTKTVSALGLDPSGARLVTGGYDYDVRFWDFAGMDASLQAFRSLQPCDCHQIKSLQYSNTGDVILVVAGNSQAKVLDRDGFPVMECVKGDQYIVDMANTKGHTAMLNAGCWHPKIKEEFLTCSNDGTVRTWDVTNEKKHKSIFKPRSMQGKRVLPTCCTYSRDGKLIAAACQDGSIQIWDRNMSVHTKFHCRQAHAPGTETSCITFSYGGTVLATRGGDDTLKTWDIRNFKKPLNATSGLSNFFPMTDCCFSPDDKLLITGTSVKKGGGSGKLLFFDMEAFQMIYEIHVTDAILPFKLKPVMSVLYRLQYSFVPQPTNLPLFSSPNAQHNYLLFCCLGADLQMKPGLHCDPQQTHDGAHQWFEKKPPSTTREKTGLLLRRKQMMSSFGVNQLNDREMKDADELNGRGGRVGTHGGTLSSFIVKNIALDKTDDSNPREAILRHAKDAEQNPYWVAPAYSETQPNAVFAEVDSDEDEEDNEPEWKKRKI